MRDGETLRTYSNKYWEMFNEIDGDFDNVAIRTFKVGLPMEHDLRKSLTKKPVRSVRRLMDHTDEYKRVEEDQQQGKGKTKVVNTIFKEPVQQLLEKIRHESFFKWPNKMAGDLLKRNQNLHCHYHQERGYTTEDCRTLWNHLEQLVKEGKQKQFLYQPNGQGNQSGVANHGGPSSRPPLGTINVIFAAPGRIGSAPFRVMSVARSLAEESRDQPKRIKASILPVLGFSEEDKVGTIQPHDDALVV
ncbi:uncharacterized protein LOC142635471 [Castanea sativa]|uniref:uncharacterized protein LOC142635471 n=1 Tax=Castanea sativa TaxID=21020 RepID=UPI003F652700